MSEWRCHKQYIGTDVCRIIDCLDFVSQPGRIWNTPRKQTWSRQSINCTYTSHWRGEASGTSTRSPRYFIYWVQCMAQVSHGKFTFTPFAMGPVVTAWRLYPQMEFATFNLNQCYQNSAFPSSFLFIDETIFSRKTRRHQWTQCASYEPYQPKKVTTTYLTTIFNKCMGKC